MKGNQCIQHKVINTRTVLKNGVKLKGKEISNANPLPEGQTTLAKI